MTPCVVVDIVRAVQPTKTGRNKTMSDVKFVSEKDILLEAAAVMLPEDQVWELLADLGIGVNTVPAVKVREVVLSHAERHGWSHQVVEATLSRLGAGKETVEPTVENSSELA